MSSRQVPSGRTRQLRLIRMRTDYVLIVVVAVLLVLGLMMVYSSTFDMAYREWGNANRFLYRQLLWTLLGTVVLIVLARVDYHFWQRRAIPIMLVSLLAMGAVTVIGKERFGAIRWLFEGSVQPSEVTKIAVIIYIAAWSTSKGDKIRQVTYGLLPFAILIGLVTLLSIYQSDLSTAVLIAVTALAMFFFAGADVGQIVATGVFSIATFAVLVITTPYRMKRWNSFIDISADPSGSSYQVRQSLIAFASGGLFGQGLGASRQKFDAALPAVHTDTIFAVLAEELGLMGCLFLLGLFVVLAYRGFKIAAEAEDPFGSILAAGLTCSLIVQALINMAVVTATLPYAGVPLPFISYGGSSLLASMASVGLLLSVSRGRREATGRERAHSPVGWGNRGSRVSPARSSRGAQKRA